MRGFTLKFTLKTQLLLAISVGIVAVLSYFWIVGKALEDPQQDCGRLRIVGNQALQEGDYKRAERLLTRALTAAEKTGNPLLIALTQSDLARAHLGLGAFQKEEGCLRAALTSFDASEKSKSYVKTRRERLSDLTMLAEVLEKQGKHAEAISTYEQELALVEADPLAPREDVFARYSELLRASGRQEELAKAKLQDESLNGNKHVAEEHLVKGYRLLDAGKLKPASEELEMASVVGRKWSNSLVLIDALTGLAMCALQQGDLVHAKALLEQARSQYKSDNDPDQIRLAHILVLSAVSLDKEGKKKEAQEMYDKAIKTSRQGTSMGVTRSGHVAFMAKHFEDSNFYLIKALAVRSVGAWPSSEEAAGLLVEIGTNFSTLGHFKESNAYFERALQIRSRTHGAESAAVFDLTKRIAQNYSDEKKYDQSIAAYQRWLRMWKNAKRPESIELAYTFGSIAGIYLQQKKFPESTNYFLKALSIFEKTKLVPPSARADILVQLGANYFEVGSYQESNIYLRRGLPLKEAIVGSKSKIIAELLFMIGRDENLLKHYTERDKYWRRSLDIYEQLLDGLHASVVLRNWAQSEASAGHYSESDSYLRRALAILAKTKDSPSEEAACKAQLAQNAAAKTAHEQH